MIKKWLSDLHIVYGLTVMKLAKPEFVTYGILFAAAGILMVVGFFDMSWAAAPTKGLGKVGINLGEQASGLAVLVRQVGFLCGVGLVVGAIVIFATMKKTNTAPVIPTLMLIAGVLLLSVFAFIAVTSESIFGKDAATGVGGTKGLGIK